MRPHRLVYSRRYRQRLEDVYERIMADKPAAAPRVIERIRTAVERLQEFPFLGRPGRVEGTREASDQGAFRLVENQSSKDASFELESRAAQRTLLHFNRISKQ